MKNVICLHPTGVGFLQFLSQYKAGGFLQREFFGFSLCPNKAREFSEEEYSALRERIVSKYPQQKVSYIPFSADFMKDYTYWVIESGDGDGYYSGFNKKHQPTFSKDVEVICIYPTKSSVEETLRTLRQSGKLKVAIREVRLTIENELLKPIFIIVCEEKRTGILKFYAGKEDFRLSETSGGATAFNCDEVVAEFEKLRASNKEYLYIALPKPSRNLTAEGVPEYTRRSRRPIVMELSLKQLKQ